VLSENNILVGFLILLNLTLLIGSLGAIGWVVVDRYREKARHHRRQKFPSVELSDTRARGLRP
jgi:hypothetical protein